MVTRVAFAPNRFLTRDGGQRPLRNTKQDVRSFGWCFGGDRAPSRIQCRSASSVHTD